MSSLRLTGRLLALSLALLAPVAASAKPTVVVSRQDFRGLDTIAGTKNEAAIPSNRLHEVYRGVLFGGKLSGIVPSIDARAAGWAISFRVHRERDTKPELFDLDTWSNLNDGPNATGHILYTGLMGDSWDRYVKDLKPGDMLTITFGYMESHTTGTYTFRGNRAIAETAWRPKGPESFASTRIKVLAPDIPIPDAAKVKAHVQSTLDQAHDLYPELGIGGGWFGEVKGDLEKKLRETIKPNELALLNKEALQPYDDRLAVSDLAVGEELKCGITVNGVTHCDVPVHAHFEAAALVKKLAPRLFAARARSPSSS